MAMRWPKKTPTTEPNMKDLIKLFTMFTLIILAFTLVFLEPAEAKTRCLKWEKSTRSELICAEWRW